MQLFADSKSLEEVENDIGETVSGVDLVLYPVESPLRISDEQKRRTHAVFVIHFEYMNSLIGFFDVCGELIYNAMIRLEQESQSSH